MILLLLLALSLTADSAKIKISKYQGKPIKDIFSTLSSFKTNILSIISKGFIAHKKVTQPSYQEGHPSPHPQVPQDLLGQHVQQHPANESPFKPKPSLLSQLSFPVVDIEEPSGLGLVKKPEQVEEMSSTMDPDNIHAGYSGIPHAGPESFVDKERVNAGFEAATDITEEKIKKIPTDLCIHLSLCLQ